MSAVGQSVRRLTTAGGSRAGARWHRVHPATVAALVVLVFFAFAAAWPGLLAVRGPIDPDLTAVLHPPGAGHLLGTDQLGRDVWSRIVHGTRVSLLTGLGAAGLGLLGGIVLALVAALGGHAADQVVMRVIEVMLSFPSLLLALLVITVLGPGPASVVAAIALAEIPHYARLTRAQIFVVRKAPYVEAARSLGRRRLPVMLRHVLPNATGPVLSLATIGIGTAVMISASLSFLGLGRQQPAPEWGAMLAEGRDFVTTAWWLAVFPGAAITLAVAACLVLGRRMRARWRS